MNHPRGANTAGTTTTNTCGFEDDLGMHGDEPSSHPSLHGRLSARSLASSAADSTSLHTSHRTHHSDC